MATPDLRSRHTASTKASRSLDSLSPDGEEAKEEIESRNDDTLIPTRISILDILRVLTGLFLLSSSLSYFITNDSIFWGYRPAFTRPARIRAWLRGPLLLTESELSLYNGTDPSRPIYLALNSTIYDVSASPHLYGPGGSYHFFSGRDATRAFVTGCFEEDLTPDLRGVEEMFVSEEVDEEPAMGGEGEEGKGGKREWKLRREREWRVGRGKVRVSVSGWEKVFDGGKGGKYFRVGRVRREEGWEGRLGERRKLCEKARSQRPKKGEREIA